MWEDRLRELRQGLNVSELIEGQNFPFAYHSREMR